MAGESAAIVQRLWNYCNVLRDDGMSYSNYVEQLTYLLFLKMDDEQVQLLVKPSAIPPEYAWQSLLGLHGDELESHYRHILAELGTGSGLTPVIFRKAQNRIQDPAKLRRLVELINGETWIGLDVDVKGSIYEGLLEKNAQDIKSGAGQYFTPRPLIQAIVDVMRPTPADTICDPAAGTCGFLLAAYDYILRNHHPLDREQLDHVTHHALRGWEIVDNAARLGVMNLHLHGIGANAETSPIHVGDSLASDPGERFSMVLTNPPFGKKSSVTYVTEEGETRRESLTVVRDEFLACYKPQNRHERVATWSEETPTGRWRAYPYDEIMARDKASLDIFWLRDESLDDSATLPHPSILAAEIVEDLRAALAQFQEIADDLSSDEAAV